MGAAQSFPVIGEAVTAVDSGIKLVISCTCAVTGDITGARKFFKDAGKTWVEYSERNVIVASVRAGIHNIAGESEEAGRVFRKMVSSVEQVADNTPVIGHAKGVYHYIAGDTKHGHNCMIGSTRSAAVLGAGALSGGLGLGTADGGRSGALGGFIYDAAVNLVEKRPYGVHEGVATAINSPKERNRYEYFRSSLGVLYTKVGDVTAGAAAAEIVELIDAKKKKSALKNKVGEEATQDLVDAAKKLETLTEDVDGDNHVCTKAKNLDTGEAKYGVNKRCRQELRVNKFKKKGEASGYTSKTNAKKGHAGEFPRASGVLEKAAKEQNIEINPISDRSSQACAEHHAFNDLGTHGEASNVSASSVMKTGEGYFMAVERCGNCKQYGSLMGEVKSDQIPGMPVPVKEFSLGHFAKEVVFTICGAKHSLKKEQKTKTASN